MTDTEAAPIWWWDILGPRRARGSRLSFTKVGSDRWVRPHADVGSLFATLGNQDKPFPPGLEPEYIFRDTLDPLEPEDLQELIHINSLAIRVSGRMIDLLRQFDLGETEIFELPFFEGKKDDPDKRMFTMIPDRDRPIPGRWGIVHARARKVAFLPEQSKNFESRGRVLNYPQRPGLLNWGPGDGKHHELALDSAVAHRGPDLWRDPQTRYNLYVSDRLKSAIEAADLYIPVLKEFVKATLV